MNIALNFLKQRWGLLYKKELHFSLEELHNSHIGKMMITGHVTTDKKGRPYFETAPFDI